jgi:predicted ATP-dependent serine protease
MEVLTLTEDPSVRLSTGIAGLDEILRGGFIPERAYLLRGGCRWRYRGGMPIWRPFFTP